MFDGSLAVPAALGDADVRSMSTAPASARTTLATFDTASPSVTHRRGRRGPGLRQPGRPDRPPGAAGLRVHDAQRRGPALDARVQRRQRARHPRHPPDLDRARATASSVAVPAGTDAGALRAAVGQGRGRRDRRHRDRPAAHRDRRARGDAGAHRCPQLNPFALVRLPTSATAAAAGTLKKIVLQQVNVPAADLAAAGLDISRAHRGAADRGDGPRRVGGRGGVRLRPRPGDLRRRPGPGQPVEHRSTCSRRTSPRGAPPPRSRWRRTWRGRPPCR